MSASVPSWLKPRSELEEGRDTIMHHHAKPVSEELKLAIDVQITRELRRPSTKQTKTQAW